MSKPNGTYDASAAFLRRIQATGDISYVSSVPEKGQYRSFAQEPPEKQREMADQMRQIAVSLEQRRIVPSDPKQHEVLAQRELANMDKRGAASTGIFNHASESSAVLTPASLQLVEQKRPDGNYDMLEFAEMMSRGASSKTSYGKDKSARRALQGSTGFHRHEARKTKFTMMEHAENSHQRFCEDEDFVYGLFGCGSVALATVMRCTQHDTAAFWLDQLRMDDPPRSQTIDAWVEEIRSDCGLPVFCAYVSRSLNRVFVVFCSDNANRYFLVMVMKVGGDKHCIQLVQSEWRTDAQERYKKLIANTETARDTRNPCAEKKREGSTNELEYWVTYDLSMCAKMGAAECSFDYAYYTMCQCIDPST